MEQLTTIQMENGQVQRLVNPFITSDSVSFPVGTAYLDKDTISEQTMTQEASSGLFFAFTGAVYPVSDPEEFFVKVGVTGNIYRNENEIIFVGNPRINFSAKRGGWKIVTVTEEIVRHNGFVPEYEVVGEFKDGQFTSFVK